MRTLVVVVCAVSVLFSCVAADTCNPSGQRVDCGYVGIQPAECYAKGCCWYPVDPNPGNLPWCFYKQAGQLGYTLKNSSRTSTGYTGFLESRGGKVYTGAISPLAMEVVAITADIVQLKIYDPVNPRWEIPADVVPAPTPSGEHLDTNFNVSFTTNPFSVQITRNSDGKVIFDTSAGDLVFEDLFLQFTLRTNTNPNLYGLGEHRIAFKLPTDNHQFTMWSRDTPTPADQNLYGSHPFYMEVTENGHAHGVFLRNSNGMDVYTSSGTVQYNVIGGVLDLYVFTGPSPAAVVTQYHSVIGLPHMPAYWTLGWHQCKYGWPSLNWVKQVVQNYSNAQIPLDTVWGDIDHMDNKEDFSFDPQNYPIADVKNFVQQLNSNGQHYVVIVDPGIHVRQGYKAYDDGVAANVFIKQADGKTDFTGVVWPGTTTFPDWFHPNTTQYWSNQITSFLNQVPIDGLWIDMNEASNFQNGAPTSQSKYNNPPYTINNFASKAPLNTKTTAMDLVHHGGVAEYDAHNLFGHMEAIATHAALLATRPGVRPFVLSRSTFAGSGSYTAHWEGDNQASFSSMASSVRQMLNFNLFGIPHFGSDICGFIGPTNEELCCRWTELGAFYPFARNHADIHSPGQEPYLWKSVTAIAKKVLAARYSLLPYYYSLFYNVHKNGGTVVRPLFMEYPTDAKTYSIDTQFLIGSSVLVSPVLVQGATSVYAYFPNDKWYSFWDHSVQASGWQNLNAPIDFIPIHIRGGIVLPLQQPALTTAATRLNPFTLLVALDNSLSASGFLYWDDGVTTDLTNSSQIHFSHSTGQLTTTVDTAAAPVPPISSFVFLGVPTAPSSVTVTISGGQPVKTQFTYNSGTLTVAYKTALDSSFTVNYA